MIGKKILHYKIIEKLGEGGMGVVYLAEDSKLKRQVAIKFLPGHIASNSDERQRFENEAQAAAALNHPNISTIHAIEEVDNDIFLVMEYITGQNLKEHIKGQPLPEEEAKDIALQIAEGLQAAHNKGIVHRDIKSANIMSDKENKIRIMDFGLAKFSGSAQVTQLGTTIGTAAYMSPEQAQGEELDQRADIWSFGVVLYEMLTGELAFKGDYEQAVIYSILNDQPDLSRLKELNVAPKWIDIIEGCLQRDISKRFSSMHEVIAILTDTKQQAVRTNTVQQYVIYALLGIVIIALLLWNTFDFGSARQDSQKETKITKITFDAGLEDEPTFSPDGKFLAYTTDDQENFDIIVKPLDGGKAIRIVDHPADDAQPSWSADGNNIAFVSSRDHSDHLSIILDQAPLTQYIYAKNGDIFVMPALGGRQIKVVENGYYPQWSPDSKRLVYQSNTSGDWDIWITSIRGEDRVRLSMDESFDYHPSWSSDGNWILYASRLNQFSNFTLKIINSSGGSPRQILATEDWILNPRFSKDNETIIFSTTRNGTFNLTKIPFDIDDLESELQYNSVTLSESQDVNLTMDAGGERIAYASVTNSPDIYQLDLVSGDITAVVADNADNDFPQLSPDGNELLYQSNRDGSISAWIKDITTNEAYSLNIREGTFRWTADGLGIIYRSEKGLVLKKPGDASEKVLVPNDSVEPYITTFSTPSWDSKYIACGSDSGIVIFNISDGKINRLTKNKTDNHPTWSPDNSLIVFQRGQGTGRNLYSTDVLGNEKQLTSGASEDSHPFWSPVNQDEILFLRDHKNLFLLTVSTGELKQLTHYNKANITMDYPSFSFDGKKALYSLFNKIGDIFILDNF